ncbi:MAG: dephospho-CoA kinase, partial [bacterium]
IERVMLRDKITETQVRARMNNQLPESEKLGKAQAIIQNDGIHDLLRQVTDIHHRICVINQKV